MISTRETRLYKVRDWRLVRQSADEIIYRPSGTILVRRVKWSILAAIIAGLYVFWIGSLVFGEPRFEGSGTISNPQHVDRDPSIAIVIRAHEERMQRQRASIFTGTSIMLLIGLLPSAFALIQRVSVQNDRRGNIVVRKRNLYTSSFAVPITAYDLISVEARPLRFQFDLGFATLKKYRWYVRLDQNLAKRGPSGDPSIAFEILQVRETSDERLTVPNSIHVFAEALSQLTGLNVRLAGGDSSRAETNRKSAH